MRKVIFFSLLALITSAAVHVSPVKKVKVGKAPHLLLHESRRALLVRYQFRIG